LGEDAARCKNGKTTSCQALARLAVSAKSPAERISAISALEGQPRFLAEVARSRSTETDDRNLALDLLVKPFAAMPYSITREGLSNRFQVWLSVTRQLPFGHLSVPRESIAGITNQETLGILIADELLDPPLRPAALERLTHEGYLLRAIFCNPGIR
jgi:hypothetical protein